MSYSTQNPEHEEYDDIEEATTRLLELRFAEVEKSTESWYNRSASHKGSWDSAKGTDWWQMVEVLQIRSPGPLPRLLPPDAMTFAPGNFNYLPPPSADRIPKPYLGHFRAPSTGPRLGERPRVPARTHKPRQIWRFQEAVTAENVVMNETAHTVVTEAPFESNTDLQDTKNPSHSSEVLLGADLGFASDTASDQASASDRSQTPSLASITTRRARLLSEVKAASARVLDLLRRSDKHQRNIDVIDFRDPWLTEFTKRDRGNAKEMQRTHKALRVELRDMFQRPRSEAAQFGEQPTQSWLSQEYEGSGRTGRGRGRGSDIGRRWW